MSDSILDPSQPLDAAGLEILLARLADPVTSLDDARALMASLDGREAQVVLPIFARLRDTRDPAELRAVSRLLSRWSERPIARALVPALQALLKEPGVADLNRATAAGLLELLGEPVDYPEMLDHMTDPSSMGQDALRHALAAVRGPASLATLLDEIAQLSTRQVTSVIDDLRQMGDRRALFILAPLTHAANPDVALTAVAALEALASPAVRPALERVAAQHAEALLRQQARLSLRRLPREAESGPIQAEPSAMEISAFGSANIGQGHGLLLLATANPDARDRVDTIALYIDRDAGVRQHALSQLLDRDAFDQLLAAFAAGGIALEPIEVEEARSILEAASLRSLRSGDGASVAHLAWLDRLDGMFWTGL